MSLALAHPSSRVLAQWLVDAGLASGPGWDGASSWPAFSDSEPQDPDSCVTAYDTSPQDDGRSMVSGERYRHLGAQVRVRSEDKEAAFRKAEAVRTALDESLYGASVTVDGRTYTLHSASRTQLMNLGREVPTSKRCVYTINAVLSLRLTG